MARHLESVYEEASGFPLFRRQVRQNSRSGTSLFQVCLVILLGLTCYLAVSRYVVTSVEVVGTSMSPTLRNQDYYLLNRWIYLFREPSRYEVVVLRDPNDYGYSVKRIVAKAGETVTFKNGAVYVDGQKLREPYLSRQVETYPAKCLEQTIHCGQDEFVVLGDNRGNSLDSRFYGSVSRQDILGLLVY